MVKKHDDEKELSCSFCGKTQNEVKKLINDLVGFLTHGHEYHFDKQNKRIGYKSSDHSISYSTSYGYYTMLAYV